MLQAPDLSLKQLVEAWQDRPESYNIIVEVHPWKPQCRSIPQAIWPLRFSRFGPEVVEWEILVSYFDCYSTENNERLQALEGGVSRRAGEGHDASGYGVGQLRKGRSTTSLYQDEF
jgi:hypothetical protein